MEVTRTLFLLFHRTASMEQQVKKYLLSKMMMMIIITVIIMMTMLIVIIKSIKAMKRWYKCRPSKWTGEGRGRRALSKRDCCHKQNQTLFILLILLQVWFSTLTHLSLKQDWFQFLSGFGKSCHSQGFSNLVLSKSFLYPSAWSPQRIAKCPEHTIASFPLNSGRQYFITCLSAWIQNQNLTHFTLRRVSYR